MRLRRPNARRTDPGTSHAAGRANPTGRASNTRMILAAFRDYGVRGATDAEAAERAGIMRPGVCWWHRASDLRAAGLIEWRTNPDGTRYTMPGHNGVEVGVSVITQAGRDALRGAA